MTTTKAGPTNGARSEADLFPSDAVRPSVKLRLGGIEKRVPELSARKNEVWQRQLVTAGQKRFGTIGRLESVDGIAKLFAGVQDVQVEMLVAYDVEGHLGGAAWILDHATATEIWEAFKEVLQAVFPFLGEARRAPALAAEILPQLVALLSSSASPPGDADSTS